MKFVKIVLVCFVLLLHCRCVTKETTTKNNQIEFKIGKQGFENKISKVFTFKDLSFGTYMTKKNSLSEKGVNLSFKIDSLEMFSLKDVNIYSDEIQKEVKENLLNLSDYDYINITFLQEIEEEGIKRVNSLKIKRPLN